MRNLYAVVAVTVVALSLWPGQVPAGTISINVTSLWNAYGQSNLNVVVENRGDEAAQNVIVAVEFMGKIAKAPTIPTMPPNLPHQAPFPIKIEKLNGTHPVIIRVAFEDLNGYPFTSVALNQLKSRDAPLSPIRVSLASATIHGQGFVTAKIFNSSDKASVARYRLIIPRELLSNDEEGFIELAPKSRETFKLHLENFSAMPGATYPVHLLLEHEEEGTHYLSTGVAVVTIFGKSFIRSPMFWVVLFVVVFAIAVSLAWRRFKIGPE